MEQRPVVLIYQQAVDNPVTLPTPDLNCVNIGPAYWIQDYLDDKGSIGITTKYGTLNAANPYLPPALNTDAVTIAEPPNNKVGALLDAASVKIYLDAARVLIVQDVTVGFDVTENDNIITPTLGSAATFTDVKAGDYFIITNPTVGQPDIVARVQAVDSTTSLRTTTNFAATGTSLIGRVERQVSNVLVDSSFITVIGNAVTVRGGVTTTLAGETVPRTINYGVVYEQYRSLRQDLLNLDTVSSLTDITTKIGRVDSRNPLAATTYTSLRNTTTQIQFMGVREDNALGHSECRDLISARDDIYAMVPVTTDFSIITDYKTYCDGLADVGIAETTGLQQRFRVVLGSGTLPTTNVISAAAHCVELTVDGAVSGTPIAAADDINVIYDAAATFVTNLVRAGDTLVIVSDADNAGARLGSYVIAEVYDEKRLRTTTAIPGTNKMTGAVRYYIIRSTGTPESVLPATWTAGSSTTTNTVTTTLDRSGGVVNEYLGKVARLTGDLTGDYLITASTKADPAEFTVYPNVTSEVSVSGTVYNTVVSVTTARAVVSRRCFRYVRNTAATFISDGVIASDIFQVPNPLTGTDYTNTYNYTVAYISSENVIVLAANTDMVAADPANGDLSLHYRISRTLNKDEQVTYLVSQAQSLLSRRAILVWPDNVVVSGLVDGSKDRVTPTVAVAADPQPGYYLAAAVGGMTAGLPSHQGFTNMTVAGIGTITHSTRYFNESQLTHLSDGGWFVFGQSTPVALPSCIHQLTTDPSTLLTGEYSVVKNVDFISLYFQDICAAYLGIYNATEETKNLIRGSLETGADLLKLRKYSRIGSPLIEATVSSLAYGTGATADRLNVVMPIKVPGPLNRIALYLQTTVGA